MELRSLNADSRSDELFLELLEIRRSHARFVDPLLVLSFLPLLHRTVRRIIKRQAALSGEDIAQQALCTLLELFSSELLENRTSHFAFAISRELKRQMFAWANREGIASSAGIETNGDLPGAITLGEAIEDYAVLRHLLERCVTKGLLTNFEVDLLIRFKLEGTSGGIEARDDVGAASNAVRQRMKRLVGKLRRLAR